MKQDQVVRDQRKQWVEREQKLRDGHRDLVVKKADYEAKLAGVKSDMGKLLTPEEIRQRSNEAFGPALAEQERRIQEFYQGTNYSDFGNPNQGQWVGQTQQQQPPQMGTPVVPEDVSYGQPTEPGAAPPTGAGQPPAIVGEQLASQIVNYANAPEGGDRISQQVASYIEQMSPEDRASLTPDVVNRLAANAQNEMHSRAVSAAVNRLFRGADPGSRDADVDNVIDKDLTAPVIAQMPFIPKDKFEMASVKQLQEWGLAEGTFVLTEDGMIYEVRY